MSILLTIETSVLLGQVCFANLSLSPDLHSADFEAGELFIYNTQSLIAYRKASLQEERYQTALKEDMAPLFLPLFRSNP